MTTTGNDGNSRRSRDGGGGASDASRDGGAGDVR